MPLQSSPHASEDWRCEDRNESRDYASIASLCTTELDRDRSTSSLHGAHPSDRTHIGAQAFLEKWREAKTHERLGPRGAVRTAGGGDPDRNTCREVRHDEALAFSDVGSYSRS